MFADSQPAIVCLAHLAWNYVWQRPQHILSRFARHYPVVYVNEPVVGQRPDGEPCAELVADDANLTAWQPIFPDRAALLDRWRAAYAAVVEELLIKQGWIWRRPEGLVARRPLIGWFYTPMPVYLLEQLPIALVVYDVMDELTSFKNAPTQLAEREARLLSCADLVFTGGSSLYTARKGSHPHVFCFPSGVDADHFGRALSPDTEIPMEIAGLRRPILGYYGVIDERLDYDLLRAVAQQRPDWSIVLVGLVAKIAREQLPQADNLHYIGQQPYERLPNFLRGFDVCLMPFAINDATRGISPTKTLEYMAGHKPIVSTPVPDVVANWADVIQIAETIDGFVSAIAGALEETALQRAQRVASEKRVVANNSWDHITFQMHVLVDAALTRRGVRAQAPW